MTTALPGRGPRSAAGRRPGPEPPGGPGAGPRGDRLALAAVVFALALFHVGTGAWPEIYDELPGQYAGAAREMLASGDWLIPRLGGVPRLQKPPPVYWATALSLRVFGPGEFGARLPTALAWVGLAAVTGAIGGRLYGGPAGAAAAAVLGTSLGAVALGKLVMPEPFLALGMALGLYAVVRLVESPGRRGWALAAWAAAAFACLAKGLHGLFFPAAIVALLAALHPAARPALRALLRPAGLALFLVLVLPWPLYVEHRFPGYLADNLLNEQMGHVLDTHFPRDSDGTPVVPFWLQHLAWWFPWLLFLPAALARGAPSRHPLRALPAAWLAVIGAAVTLSAQRQDYYSIALWPAFALLVGGAWDGRPARPARRPRVRLALLATALLGALAIVAWALPGPAPPSGPPVTPFEDRNSIAGAIAGMGGERWWRLRPLLLLSGAGLLAGAGAGLALLRRPAGLRWSWAPVALGSLAVLAAATLGLQAVAPYFGLKAVARALPRAGSALVVYDGPSHRGSSLAFYAAADLRWLGPGDAEFAVRSRGAGAERFLTARDVVERWRRGEPVWLITEESRLERWGERLGAAPGPPVARSGTRVLVASPAARAPAAR